MYNIKNENGGEKMSKKTEYLRDLVEWLLESKITGCEIERQTGVARSTISQLRTKQAALDNIPLIRIERLAIYAEEKRN